MDGNRSFEHGEMIRTFTGQYGMVVSSRVYQGIRKILKEGKRPGYYFAPGCCHNPDYVVQIPVLFEDGTYDVMRAMSLKRAPEPPPDKKRKLQELMEGYED